MSTVEAIRFRHLAAQLTSTETTRFFCELLNLNGNIFNTALFYYVIQLPSNRKADAHTITDVVSNIILSREKTPKVIPTPNIKLNELPQALIATAASFLRQRDYNHLSECSRSLFIGCNAPNQMQQLDLRHIKQHSNINFSHFPSIKTLRINVNKMEQLSGLSIDAPQVVFNHLKFMSLDRGVNCNSGIDFIDKLTKHVPNTKDITHLTLENMSSLDELPELLIHFENMSYLRFISCYDDEKYDLEIPFIPKLRGLAVTHMEGHWESLLVHACADQLECLELEQGPKDDYDLSHLEFRKLKELVLYHPSLKTITDIAMSAENLRQVDVDPRYCFLCDGSDMHLSQMELTSAITNLLESCKRLGHFAVNGFSDTIEATLEGIESGMLRTLKRRRESLKIIVWMHTWDETDESDEWNESVRLTHKSLALIERITVLMEQSNTTHFMLALAGTNSPVKIDKTNVSKSLETISKNDNICIKEDEYNICIMNKECKIDSCRAIWKLEDQCSLYE